MARVARNGSCSEGSSLGPRCLCVSAQVDVPHIKQGFHPWFAKRRQLDLALGVVGGGRDRTGGGVAADLGPARRQRLDQLLQPLRGDALRERFALAALPIEAAL